LWGREEREGGDYLVKRSGVDAGVFFYTAGANGPRRRPMAADAYRSVFFLNLQLKRIVKKGERFSTTRI
jgi:hypothetical protein